MSLQALRLAAEVGYSVPYVLNSRGNCHASLAALVRTAAHQHVAHYSPMLVQFARAYHECTCTDSRTLASVLASAAGRFRRTCVNSTILLIRSASIAARPYTLAPRTAGRQGRRGRAQRRGVGPGAARLPRRNAELPALAQPLGLHLCRQQRRPRHCAARPRRAGRQGALLRC